MSSVAGHCRSEPALRDALLATYEDSNFVYTPALLFSLQND